MPVRHHVLSTACATAFAMLAVSSPLTARAAADSHSAGRAVQVDTQADAQGNRLVMGQVSLPVGARHWVQLGAGQARVTQAGLKHRPGVFSLGAGTRGEGWSGAANLTHRRDGARLRQTDGAATVEWQHRQLAVGLDASYRDALLRGEVPAVTGSGGPATVPVTQRLKGPGFGGHAALQLTPAWTLTAGAMHYRYRARTEQDGATSGVLNNAPLLGPALGARTSLVARDEAALSRSMRVGAAYAMATATLGADYIADHVIDVPGPVRTLQLKAVWNAAPGWMLTPSVGRTRGSAGEGVNFAGLSVGHGW